MIISFSNSTANHPSSIQWTRVAESVSSCFGWSRIPNNTGSQSWIFLSNSGCPNGSFFTSHS